MTAEAQSPEDRSAPTSTDSPGPPVRSGARRSVDPRRARRCRPLDREQQQQPAVAVHRDHGAVDPPCPPRRRPAPDARPRDGAGSHRDRPPVRSRRGPSTTPTTTAASPSDCSSLRRSSTSARGSAGSNRPSARPRTGSSASRTDGWSGRSSRSVIRRRRRGRPSRRPARPVSRGARPCSRSAGRPADRGRASGRRRRTSARRRTAPLRSSYTIRDRWIGPVVSSAAMKTILVVDDERHIVDLVRLYLEKEGYAVVTAARRRGGPRSLTPGTIRTWSSSTSSCRRSTGSRSAARSAAVATRPS